MDELEKDLTQGEKPADETAPQEESVLGSLFKAWSNVSTDEIKTDAEKTAEKAEEIKAEVKEEIANAKEEVKEEVKEETEKAPSFMEALAAAKKPVVQYEEPEEEPKKTNFKLIGIVAGVAVVLVVLLLVLLLHKTTIDISDYTTITFDGCNSFGKPIVKIDYDKLQADYGEKVKVNKSKSKNDLESALNSLLSDYVTTSYVVQTCSKYTVTPADKLTNGDEVTLTWNIDTELFEKMTNGKLKGSDIKVKAEGLKEIEIFDPFEGLEINYEGYSGEGYINYTAPSKLPVKSLYFSVNYTNELSNGDKLIFTVYTNRNSDVEEYCRENGYMPSSTTKEIVVSGLKEYQDADLFADIEVVFNGASGLGTVEIKTDKVTIENIRYEADKTIELKNGDVVKVTVSSTGWWSDLASTLKNQGYNLKESEKEYTVSGLGEYDMYDPFSEAEVEYEGPSTEASVKVVPGDTKMAQYFSYRIDKTYNLSNGDEITITPYLASGSIEDFIEKFDKMPDLAEKKFTVDGLKHYFEDGDEIDKDCLDTLMKQMDDIFASYDDDDTEFDSSEYAGNIVLMNKKSNENYLFVIYKNNYVYTYPADDADEDDGFESYEIVRFRNILVDPDGKCDVDPLDYSLNPYGNNWKYEHEAGNRWGSTYDEWTISGFETIDDVKAQVITKFRENYFYVDNVNEK